MSTLIRLADPENKKRHERHEGSTGNEHLIPAPPENVYPLHCHVLNSRSAVGLNRSYNYARNPRVPLACSFEEAITSPIRSNYTLRHDRA